MNLFKSVVYAALLLSSCWLSEVFANAEAQVAQSTKQRSELELNEQLTTKQYGAAKAQDWASFIEVFEQKRGISKSAGFFSVYLAIRFDAPIPIMQDLLNRGAAFLPDHATFVATKGDVERMIQLESLGLDIHGINSRGENALNAMIELMQHEKMFRYLLERDVPMLPFSDGKSLLYRSLEQLSEKKRAVYYVNQLLKYGAPIDKNSEAFLAELATRAPKSYGTLTEVMPELSISN